MGFVSVPMTNKSSHGNFQLTSGVEHAVSEHAFLNDAEEDLDLVDPRGVNRSVEEAKPITVTPIELPPALVFAIMMYVEVVPDDVDFLFRVQTRNGLHKVQEVGGLATFPDFSVNLSLVWI